MRRCLTSVTLPAAPPWRGAGALAHLDEDQRAVGLAHNQIDLATATSRRLEIALNQPQALALQMGKGRIFRRIAALLGAQGRRDGRRWLRAKKPTFLAKSHCLQAPHPC